MSTLDLRSFKKRLSVLTSFGEKEQHLAVSKRASPTSKDQTKTVLNAFHDCNLDDKVRIIYFDMTACSTGSLNVSSKWNKNLKEKKRFVTFSADS